MELKSNILGCFMKIGFDPKKSEQDFMALDNLFSPYVWGANGINNYLKSLKFEDYGQDLKLALFQFNVEPTELEKQKLKQIDSYRAKEKSIGIPIIIDDKNFFSKSEEGRFSFLKQSIFQKLELLKEVVKKKKLDTNMDLLISDLRQVLG
ncbi:hypothetical protein MCERE19_04422 [Spirosomataceae bacterium]|jgi:hypothetical protein